MNYAENLEIAKSMQVSMVDQKQNYDLEWPNSYYRNYYCTTVMYGSYDADLSPTRMADLMWIRHPWLSMHDKSVNRAHHVKVIVRKIYTHYYDALGYVVHDVHKFIHPVAKIVTRLVPNNIMLA